MAAKSGYERLAQVDEDDGEPLANSRSTLSKSVNILAQPTHVQYLPASSLPHDTNVGIPTKTRHRSNSGIDIKAINARLER
jgi:hypothetical protein